MNTRESHAKTYNIVLLPGDGIGVDVVAEARRVLEAVVELANISLEITQIPCGAQYFLDHGQDWPDGAPEACERADAIILGAIGLPTDQGRHAFLRPDGKIAGWSAIVGNRIKLDLYANIRPVKLLPGVRHLVSGFHKQVWEPENVDLVMIRENTEDLYAGAGGILAPGGQAQVAIDTRIVTRQSSERIIRLAFETAKRRDGAPADGVQRVTCVCKDNVLYGCRMFCRIVDEVAEEYPQIEHETVLVDAFTQWLIRQPEHYDVVVTTNMFGDIITELAAVLQGGMGMAVGCNIGDRHGMFEPIHGSAPKHAGKDRVNPMAAIAALGEALIWLGQRSCDAIMTQAGVRVHHSIAALLHHGETLTYDIVGKAKASSTSTVTTAIINEFKALS